MPFETETRRAKSGRPSRKGHSGGLAPAVMTEPAKLLLLASLLAQDRIISNNGKAFLKELILGKDRRLFDLLKHFETDDAQDRNFLQCIHALIEQRQEALFDQLFANCTLEDGKMLSKGERDRYSLTENKSLIYGEVEFRSCARVLRKINPNPGSVFYDLGSGTGRAVFVARLTQDFSRCVGIELLSSLHGAAADVATRYDEQVKELLNSCQSEEVELVHGSILEVDWSDGDVVLANSTCFEEDLMKALAHKAAELKPGAYVVTFTKGLESKHFEVLEKKRYKMSWGPATVFIHRRLNHDGTPHRAPGEEEQRDSVNGLSIFYEDEDDSYHTDEEEDDEDLEEDDEDDEEEEEGREGEDGDGETDERRLVYRDDEEEGARSGGAVGHADASTQAEAPLCPFPRGAEPPAHGTAQAPVQPEMQHDQQDLVSGSMAEQGHSTPRGAHHDNESHADDDDPLQ